MRLFELWDDVLKQREAQKQNTASTVKPSPANNATGPKKPLTAKERMDQRTQERKDAEEKRKADMKKRSSHFGKPDQESED